MKRLILATALALAVATPAMADCIQVGNQTYCKAQPKPEPQKPIDYGMDTPWVTNQLPPPAPNSVIVPYNGGWARYDNPNR